MQPAPELITPGLDWPLILKTASRHGIAPSLFKLLSDESVQPLIPNAVWDKLKETYFRSLLNNKRLYLELENILKPLSEATIPVLLLKGAALCLTTYDDMALRPFGDLDILVPKQAVPLCQNILEQHGYALLKGIYFPIDDENNDDQGCEWSYLKGAVVVEIHWDLMNQHAPFAVDIASFWEGVNQVRVGTQQSLVMSAENQLMHLCLHQFKHHWEHIRDLTDVCLLIERFGSDLDWPYVINKSKTQGIAKSVHYTLDLGQKLLGTPIPQWIFPQLLGRHRPPNYARVMTEVIAANIFELNLPRRFWELLLVDGIKVKATMVKSILLHPFPRYEESTNPVNGDQRSSRAKAAIKSLLFYRQLLTTFFRNLIFNKFSNSP